MAITHTNPLSYAQISSGYFRAATPFTLENLTSGAGAAILPTDPAVGDSIVFDSNSKTYPYTTKNVTMTTPIAATITGVWEYISRTVPDSDTSFFIDASRGEWKPFSNVVDGTNNLTQNGTVTWDIPTDWSNYILISGMRVYSFYVRFRITSISNVTNRGENAGAVNVSNTLLLSGGIPFSLNDFYQYSEANNLGWIYKSSYNSYIVNCMLMTTYEQTNVWKETNSNIEFINGYKCLFPSQIDLGELVNGVTKNGVNILFSGTGCSYYSTQIGNGTNSGTWNLFDSRIEFKSPQGGWGGGIVASPSTNWKSSKLINCRSLSASETKATINGIEFSNHFEPPALTVIDCKCVGTALAARCTNNSFKFTGLKQYYHRTDVSNTTNNFHMDFYRVYELETTGARFSFVDCKLSPNLVFVGKFIINSADNTSLSVLESYGIQRLTSIQLSLKDTSLNAINTAKAAIFDKNGENMDSNVLNDDISVRTSLFVNSDGYLTTSEVTVTSVTSDSEVEYTATKPLSKGREILFPSTSDRTVLDGRTGTTTLGFAETVGAVTAGDKAIEIPYVLHSYNRPNLVNLTGTADTVYLSPFTLKIRKYGFKELTVASNFDDGYVASLVMLSNSNATGTEAEALAITGITVDKANKTITLSEDKHLGDIYRFLNATACNDLNMDFPATIEGNKLILTSGWTMFKNANIIDEAVIVGDITSSLTSISDLTIEGSLTVSSPNVTLTNTTVTGTLNTTSSTAVDLVDSTVSTVGANVTITVKTKVTISNIVAGSIIRLYDTNNTIMPFNTVDASTIDLVTSVDELKLVTLFKTGYVPLNYQVQPSEVTIKVNQVIDKLQG